MDCQWLGAGDPFILRIDFAARHLELSLRRGYFLYLLDSTAFVVSVAWRKSPTILRDGRRSALGGLGRYWRLPVHLVWHRSRGSARRTC